MNVPKQWIQRKRNLRQRKIEGFDITSMMVVPNTEGSELFYLLVQKEAQLCKISGYRMKMVEGNGVPLSRLFSTPLTPKWCHNASSCNVCNYTEEKASRCIVRNVVYKATFLVCEEIFKSSQTCASQVTNPTYEGRVTAAECEGRITSPEHEGYKFRL